MKSVLLISFISLLFFNVNAQKETPESLRLYGKLIKKEWSKSTESYCAQGSDYYVLQVNDSQRFVILEFDDKISRVSKFDNEKVIVVGNHIEKRIASENEISQKPINSHSTSSEKEETFTCKVFKVSVITLER